MTDREGRFRIVLGWAILAIALLFIIPILLFFVSRGEDSTVLSANVLLSFFVGLLPVGFTLIVIDSPLLAVRRKVEEEERQKQREFEEQQQEKRNLAHLRDQLRSRVPGFAAHASEELQRLGWFRANSLNGINLGGANLSGASLRGVKMREVEGRDADFSNADLRYVDFTEADLRRADFSGSDLSGAKFVDANLAHANFAKAFLDGADFSSADLTGANLKSASISGAKIGWDGSDDEFEFSGGITLPAAKFDEHTILPDGTMWTDRADVSRFVALE